MTLFPLNISANIDFTDLLEPIKPPRHEESWYDHGTPWTAHPHRVRRPLASFKPADIKYDSWARAHRQAHWWMQQERKKANTTYNQAISARSGEGAYLEHPGFDQVDSFYILAQNSTAEKSRNRRTSECHDVEIEFLRLISRKYGLWGAVDCTSFSVETLSSVFYPGTWITLINCQALTAHSLCFFTPYWLFFGDIRL